MVPEENIVARPGSVSTAFICATGTGGTLAGTGRFLKEKSQGRTQVWLADPPGSVLHSYIEIGGTRKDRSGRSITEGIGQGRITTNFGTFVEQLDGSLHIADEKPIETLIYDLLDTEGLYLGASSARNVVAAVELAQKLGPGHTVATIFCDATRAASSRRRGSRRRTSRA